MQILSLPLPKLYFFPGKWDVSTRLQRGCSGPFFLHSSLSSCCLRRHSILRNECCQDCSLQASIREASWADRHFSKRHQLDTNLSVSPSTAWRFKILAADLGKLSCGFSVYKVHMPALGCDAVDTAVEFNNIRRLSVPHWSCGRQSARLKCSLHTRSERTDSVEEFGSRRRASSHSCVFQVHSVVVGWKLSLTNASLDWGIRSIIYKTIVL